MPGRKTSSGSVPIAERSPIGGYLQYCTILAATSDRIDMRHDDAVSAGIEQAGGVEMLVVRHAHDRGDPDGLGERR